MRNFVRSVIPCLTLICSAAFSQTITQESTIYERPGFTFAEDAPVLTVHFIDIGGADAIWIGRR